jgi:hypothetical protein
LRIRINGTEYKIIGENLKMKIRNYPLSIVLLLSFLIIQGCSIFQSRKSVDMTSFSETMLTMVGDIQFGLQGKSWVYLKPYLNSEAVRDAAVGLDKMRGLMRGIVFYSIQVVSINSAEIPESEKCRLLGQYLDEALRPAIKTRSESGRYSVTISLDTFQLVIEEIKSQKKFLEALEKAQPVIDAVVGYSDGIFNDLKARVKTAVNEISGKIENDFASIRSNISEVEELQTRTVDSYWLLYRYKFGKKDALDSLLYLDPSVKNYVSADNNIQTDQLALLQEDLIKRMNNIKLIKEQLVPEFELYKSRQKELDEINGHVNDMMRRARIAMIVFARAHRNLAAGVTIPPDIDVLGGASKMLNKFVP